MGQITKVTTGDEELPEALTETAVGGARSGNYLADQPAIAALRDDEQPRFVLTNQKQGIAIRGDTTRHVMPDNQYRTVVVVTDQRAIALVGMTDGDEQFTLDISEITDVTTVTERRSGQLRIDRTGGPTWKVSTAVNGLAEVAGYLRAQSGTERTGGESQSTTSSLRGLFETTVNTAKSLKDDRVAEMIPTVDQSPMSKADDDAEASSTARPDTDTASPQRDSRVDRETAITRITQALATTDWRARSSPPGSPFDLLAAREDELMGILVHCPEDGRIGREALKRCDTVTGAAGTDSVMLATTGTVTSADARLATELGVRLRKVETLCDATDPPTIEAVGEMIRKVLAKAGWTVRTQASGPFDMLASHGDGLTGVVVHGPEDRTVERSLEYCHEVTGAAGTDSVILATTGTVQESDERVADELGVRLVTSESLRQHHVTEIEQH